MQKKLIALSLLAAILVTPFNQAVSQTQEQAIATNKGY